MPTGYTSDIAKGISFYDFTMLCARAFGACISMRDEPFNAPIPDEFKPSDYHVKNLESLQAELKTLKEMPLDEAGKRAETEYKEQLVSIERRLAEKNSLRGKYSAMLAEVNRWTPPSPDHVELKSFMVKQITQSIDFDCDTSYTAKELENLRPKSAEVWRADRLATVISQIQYHTEHNQEEIDRANSRTLWVKQLRKSLEQFQGKNTAPAV